MFLEPLKLFPLLFVKILKLPTGRYNNVIKFYTICIFMKIPKKIAVEVETKQKILNSAAELFAKEGFYKVSVREICSSAGVTKPVLYYYFENKENLLEELVNETYLRFDELRLKHIPMQLVIEELVDGIVEVYIEFVKHYPHFVRFSAFIQSSNVPELIREKKLLRYKSEMSNFTRLLKGFQNAGRINEKYDPSILAINFLGPILLILIECVIYEDRGSMLAKRLRGFVKFWKDQYLNKSLPESK